MTTVGVNQIDISENILSRLHFFKVKIFFCTISKGDAYAYGLL